MILNVHDMRNWLQPHEGTWINGARYPGITIYNDPPKITFRKNDSESRMDLVITLDKDGNWIANFYKDDDIVKTIRI